jgi:hypothetical protein
MDTERAIRRARRPQDSGSGLALHSIEPALPRQEFDSLKITLGMDRKKDWPYHGPKEKYEPI